MDQLESNPPLVVSDEEPAALREKEASHIFDNYSFDHTYSSDLPITSYRQQIVDTIESNSVTVIQGVLQALTWAVSIILIIIIKLIANWWAWEPVPWKIGCSPMKIPGITRRFHGNLMSRNQPFKQPLTSTITLKELQWRNFPDLRSTMNHFLWGVERAVCGIGKIGDQSSDPQSSTEQANCKYGDQSSDLFKVVWWVELTCKQMVRKVSSWGHPTA